MATDKASPVTRLHALILQSDRTWDEAADFIATAFRTKEQVVNFSISGRNLRRIAQKERPGHIPNPIVRRALSCAYDESFENLLLSPAVDLDIAELDRRPGRFDTSAEYSSGARKEDFDSSNALERQVAMAARKAFTFSTLMGSGIVGPEVVENLYLETKRLATEYQIAPIDRMLGDLVNLQDITFRLLETRQRPADARELYVVAGITSGMLANASHDLGDNQSALMQARTAYMCADNAGHDTLCAWVRGVQSMVCYWAGWSKDAAEYAALGLEPASRTRGTVAAWIPSLQARAWSLLGNEEEVQAAIVRAERAREQVIDSDLDDLGGKLTFPHPRQLYYAADASSRLPTSGKRTIELGEMAISEYEKRTDSERSYIDESIARTDVALAHVRTGDMEAARVAIAPVLDLAPNERIGGVIVNATRLGAEIRTQGISRSSRARDLVDELEGFARITAAALPR